MTTTSELEHARNRLVTLIDSNSGSQVIIMRTELEQYFGRQPDHFWEQVGQEAYRKFSRSNGGRDFVVQYAATCQCFIAIAKQHLRCLI